MVRSAYVAFLGHRNSSCPLFDLGRFTGWPIYGGPVPVGNALSTNLFSKDDSLVLDLRKPNCNVAPEQAYY